MSRFCPKTWLKFSKAVSDEQRQEILAMIQEKDQMNGTEIMKKIKLSQPTVSHHLKILCDAQVVCVQKKGKERYYSLLHKHIHSCCSDFLEKFTKHKNKQL